MLIFVDKKKEHRRKVKIFCAVCFAVIFALANFYHFKSALHHSQEELTNYHSRKIINDWYNKADIVYLFTSKQNPDTKIILIPHTFNRENLITTAFAFSKLPVQSTYLKFGTTENTEPLKKLASLFLNLTEKKEAEQTVIISASFADVEQTIRQKNLYPQALSFKHTKKLDKSDELTVLLDSIFPPAPAPQNHLEEQKFALQKFAEENKQTIEDIIFHKKTPPFALQNIFLKTNRLCLQNKDKRNCRLHTNTDFTKSLQKLAKNTPKSNYLKLILLTDDTLISQEDVPALTSDEGLHFIFNKHEAFLFPEEIKSLAEKENVPYILKERAGINPTYHNSKMKLYKFKIMEIDLDDNL